MKMPSQWNESLAAEFPHNPTIRELVASCLSFAPAHAYDTDIQHIFASLSRSPSVPPDVSADADRFGNVSWFSFVAHAYAQDVRDLHLPEFEQFARAQFSVYAGDIGRFDRLSTLTATDWSHIIRLHFTYLVFAAFEFEDAQKALDVRPPRLVSRLLASVFGRSKQRGSGGARSTLET